MAPGTSTGFAPIARRRSAQHTANQSWEPREMIDFSDRNSRTTLLNSSGFSMLTMCAASEMTARWAPGTSLTSTSTILWITGMSRSPTTASVGARIVPILFGFSSELVV